MAETSASTGRLSAGRSATRTRRADVPVETDTPGDTISRGKRRIFLTFIICLLIPGSFFLGGARLTPYRLFLLLAFVPLAISFLRGMAGRLTGVDVLILLYVLWLGISVLVHEGFGRIEFVVIAAVEAMCGYLIGRVLVREKADYKAFFQCFLLGLLFMAPFALLEMVTKINLVSKITGMFMQPFGQAVHPPRLGLHRAQVSFEHPILFGLFCSLGFANAFYIFRDNLSQRFVWMGSSFFTTFASLSSAPLLALMMQSVMMTWDRMLSTVRNKWIILAGTGGSVFLFLELVTPNGAVDFLISNLTLVPATAEYRLLTFEYAINALLANPAFGVGAGGDIDLPWWHTGSIDNFWLSTAVGYGAPTVGFLICAILLHLGRVMWAKNLDETASDYRSGHFIAVAGLIFTLTTVHLWGAANVMVMAYLGAGAWIYTPKATPARIRRNTRREKADPDPAAQTVPGPVQEKPLSRPPGRVRSRPSGSTGRFGGGQR